MRALIDKKTAVERAKESACNPFGAALIVRQLEDMPEVKRDDSIVIPKGTEEMTELIIQWLLCQLDPVPEVASEFVDDILKGQSFHMRLCFPGKDLDIESDEGRTKISWTVETKKLRQHIGS